jgi:hypothetical protein
MTSLSLLTTENIQGLGSPFSPQEIALYTSLFRHSKKSVDGFVSGDDMADFLKSSGLLRRTLHDIWSMCDTANLGRLNFDSFCRCCRLVAHAQQGALAITPELLTLEPPRLPYFSVETKSSIWQLTDSELDSFKNVFAQYRDGVVVRGVAAKTIFLKSGLTEGDLSLIWDMADSNEDGDFDFGEFLVAMALISKVRKEKIVPKTVPEELAHLFLEESGPIVTSKPAKLKANQELVSLQEIAKKESQRLEEATTARMRVSEEQSKAAVQYMQAERELKLEQSRANNIQESILSFQSRIADVQNELEQLGYEPTSLEPNHVDNVSWLEDSIRETTAKLESLGRKKSQLRILMRNEKEKLFQKTRDKSLLQIAVTQSKDRLNELRKDRIRSAYSRDELNSNLILEVEPESMKKTTKPYRDSKGVKMTDSPHRNEVVDDSLDSAPSPLEWATFGNPAVSTPQINNGFVSMPTVRHLGKFTSY